METPTLDTTAGIKNPETKQVKRSTKKSSWWKRGPNLVQHTRTGTFYARIKIGGNTIRTSLDTDVLTVAKLRLPDKIKELQKPKVALGTFKEARLLFEADLASDHTLKPASKYYRGTRIKALIKSWPGLDDEKLERIAAKDEKGKFKLRSDFNKWAKEFSEKFDEQNFNNTLGTFRMILERGGLRRDDNPAYEIARVGVKPSKLELPEPGQFDKLVESIETAGAPQSRDCANLVRFLAFSGCRISEARQVTWADVDMERNEIKVCNAKRAITSNGTEFRFAPIIPPMRELLERLKLSNPLPSDRVCVLGECERSLTRACGKVEISRLTHHDLRHLFASRCIASGVDIPTISRWLGHSDGGALAMRVYGHLQREHSQSMAVEVSFGGAKPENVIPLPKQAEA